MTSYPEGTDVNSIASSGSVGGQRRGDGVPAVVSAVPSAAGHEFGADGVRHPVADGGAAIKRIHPVFLQAGQLGCGQRRPRRRCRQRRAALPVQSHAGRLQ